MDWVVVLSLVASVVAIWVAISSKKQAKETADESLRIQKRMEMNQFYPIIELGASYEEGKVNLLINNRSDQNTASEYTVKFSLLLIAKDMNVEASGEFKGSEIKPASSAKLEPKVINTYISDSMPFIERSDRDSLRIRVRFWVQYKAAHPESLPMSGSIIFRLEKSNDGFTLIEEHL